VKLVESPSCSATSKIILVGRSKSGNWVAMEQNGLYGGMFVSRAEALKYALFENGHHRETIVELSREIEFDVNGPVLGLRSQIRQLGVMTSMPLPCSHFPEAQIPKCSEAPAPFAPLDQSVLNASIPAVLIGRNSAAGIIHPRGPPSVALGFTPRQCASRCVQP
jgi:hypothetical protein